MSLLWNTVSLILLVTATVVVSKPTLLSILCTDDNHCYELMKERADNIWEAAEICNKNNFVLAEIANGTVWDLLYKELRATEVLTNLEGELIYTGMNSMLHEGVWILSNGQELDRESIQAQFFNNERCSAIEMYEHPFIAAVPCKLSQGQHPASAMVLCQQTDTQECFMAAPEQPGFKFISVTNGQKYGSVATYSCKGIRFSSRCFGTLGWDERDIRKQSCLEEGIPPLILPFTFEDSPVKVGSSAEAKCVALVSNENPSLNFQWKFEGEDIRTVEGATVTYMGSRVSKLTIDEATEKLSGTYTCAITTSTGENSVEAELIVRGRGPPSAPPNNLQVRDLDQHTLEVKWSKPLGHSDIEGYSVGLKISSSNSQFLFDTVDSDKGEKGEYRILFKDLRSGTEYSVVVEAFNSMGVGPRSVEVRANTTKPVPKEPPQDVMCAPTSSTSLILSWTAPSSSSANGVITWYKVSFVPTQEQLEETTINVTTTIALLDGLQPYTTYTVTVLASNKGGDGLPSLPVVCQTEEGLPGPPEDVKALSKSSTSVLVSWKTPRKANGIILGYIVDVPLSDDNVPQKFLLPSYPRSHEVTGLNLNQEYSFLVRATSLAGQGSQSKTVTAAPTENVPAKIASFASTITTELGESVTFPCNAVGDPKYQWTLPEAILTGVTREPVTLQVDSDGSLLVEHVTRYDIGEYTCFVKNEYGNDSVKHILNILVPPEPPKLTVVNQTPDSIDIRLEDERNRMIQVLGYIVHYKPGKDNWKSVNISANTTSYQLKHLLCGTEYLIYVQAFNEIGVGKDSDILDTRTNLQAPSPPETSQFLTVSYSEVNLDLMAWEKSGCSVTSMTVELKVKNIKEWTLLRENITSRGSFDIFELLPATWHDLRVIAENDAGITTAEYQFVTLTENGEKPFCPGPFKKIEEKCICLSDNRVTNAYEAAERCKERGALLAEIPDRTIHDGIIEYLRERGMQGEISIFLGMNDILEEGRWELYDGTVLPLPGQGVYTPLSHKVDNWLDVEDCSGIQPHEDYLINDIVCTIERGVNDWPLFYPKDLPFLCEWRNFTTGCAKSPPDVPNFTKENISDDSVTYRCNFDEKTYTSKCYGTLGWDLRQVKAATCEEKVQCIDEVFEAIEGKCYTLPTKRAASIWNAADYCNKWRLSVLAEIPNKAVQDGITEYLRRKDMGQEVGVFLGMNDILEEGFWKLSDGTILPEAPERTTSPLFYHFDNYLDAEDCSAIIGPEGFLVNDVPCTIRRGEDGWPMHYPKDLPFLCEYRKNTGCTFPPPQVPSFTITEGHNNTGYGSTVEYECNYDGFKRKATCYGTLGWDLRAVHSHKCEETGCKKFYSACDDGSCIHYTKFCDKHEDCPNGEDEEHEFCAEFNSTCSWHSFPCYDGSCVFQEFVCNGRQDCPDGSDEHPEFCAGCEGARFLCDNGTKCLERINLCDTYQDCTDGSDEDSEKCAKEKCSEPFYGCSRGPCILKSQICDGVPDCWDKEDETLRKCRFHCEAHEFKCEVWGNCISGDETCDGDDSCSDGGSDEDPAFCADCGMQFQCPNGRCIRNSSLCDSLNNCGDGYDEIPNICEGNAKCGKGMFMCDNGECISLTLMCNSEDDCGDNSDEPPRCTAPRCPDQFECKTNQRCVPFPWVCDGHNHCPDGSDEADEQCKKEETTTEGVAACSENQFQCNTDKSCINKDWTCDGANDCADGSDEEAELCKKEGNATCSDGFFQCKTDKKCIQPRWVCDGDKDCTDGSDEEGQNCVVTCSSGFFQCKSDKGCIKQNWVCDGDSDCPDGSDEEGEDCKKQEGTEPCPDLFRCKSDKRCIKLDWVCDGDSDCPDGSDEDECGKTKEKVKGN